MQLKFVKSLLSVFLFVSMSAIAWFFFNNQIVAAEIGFDPLRYEYMAREGGFTSLADVSSSYVIVILLQFLYNYLPYYVGFVIFIGSIFYLVSLISPPDFVSYALFSPITFFYLAQTGKDGIAILALIVVAILASSPKKIGLMVVVCLVCLVALAIRPPLFLSLIVVYAMFKYGEKKATHISILLMLGFLYFYDKSEVLNTLDSIAGDEGSGLIAKILREYSFGYDISPVLLRFFLFFISPVLQPLAAIVKIMAGADFFIIFEGVCSTAFLVTLLWKKLLIRFFYSSLPLVIIISTVSPFYHFRYLAICYPVLMVFTLLRERQEVEKKINPNASHLKANAAFLLSEI